MKAKERKIINVGGSYGVTIPKSFAKKNSLRFGDKVGIISDDIYIIVIPRVPEESEEQNENKG
jgi:antitoxin component of MazEF toxin-antitoxin module